VLVEPARHRRHQRRETAPRRRRPMTAVNDLNSRRLGAAGERGAQPGSGAQQHDVARAGGRRRPAEAATPIVGNDRVALDTPGTSRSLHTPAAKTAAKTPRQAAHPIMPRDHDQPCWSFTRVLSWSGIATYWFSDCNSRAAPNPHGAQPSPKTIVPADSDMRYFSPGARWRPAGGAGRFSRTSSGAD
jgi:hypothetical protein